MAYPTGTGSERLKTSSITAFDHTADNKLLDGVDLHIYTILSIIVVNYVWPSAVSGNRVEIVKGDSSGALIPSYGTFVFSDKFVITGTDELIITAKSGGGGDLDAWCTYIDQDWT